MVGKTEEQLTVAGIPYEAGIAQYKDWRAGSCSAMIRAC